MQRVSTNATLFYRLFLPIFWTVFFGAFTIAVFVANRQDYGGIPGNMMRMGTGIFYLSGLTMIYFTIFKLKRVEMDKEYVFVTNYIKSFRYPWHNIATISEHKFLFLKLVTIKFKTPGHFGRKIVFAASHKLYASFWDEHPGLEKQMNTEMEKEG